VLCGGPARCLKSVRRFRPQQEMLDLKQRMHVMFIGLI
jgi:hypothetical protein